MNIKPIKTEFHNKSFCAQKLLYEKDYQLALAKVRKLMDAEINTPEGHELDVLATLIESDEAKHYAIAPQVPIKISKSLIL